MERSLDSYYPEPNDIKEKNLRKIYSRVPLDAGEEEAITVFRNYTQQNNIEIPEW